MQLSQGLHAVKKPRLAAWRGQRGGISVWKPQLSPASVSSLPGHQMCMSKESSIGLQPQMSPVLAVEAFNIMKHKLPPPHTHTLCSLWTPDPPYPWASNSHCFTPLGFRVVIKNRNWNLSVLKFSYSVKPKYILLSFKKKALNTWTSGLKKNGCSNIKKDTEFSR